VMVPTPAVRNLIREGKTHQIYSAIQTSGSVGMQTMDAALAQLARQGKITRQLAEQRASVPEELKRLLGGAPPGGNGAAQAQQQQQQQQQQAQPGQQPVGANYRSR
jgi:Tfp pilus assembly ATPase PilU